MDAEEINAYFERAREIIGDRTQGEIDYDTTAVENLGRGMDMKKAVRSANQQHPDEALSPAAIDWADLEARYTYLAEHKAILKRIGVRE